MADTTIVKVSSEASPKGDMGQVYLATGKGISMRLWREQMSDDAKPDVSREYETVGYVISGRAELHLEGQMVLLEPGVLMSEPFGVGDDGAVARHLVVLDALQGGDDARVFNRRVAVLF